MRREDRASFIYSVISLIIEDVPNRARSNSAAERGRADSLCNMRFLGQVGLA